MAFAFPAFADPGQGGQEIAVLKSGVGARALGMGSAFTAIADNADAPFHNPAGLSQIKQNELTAMQTKLSSDADHYYVSWVTPFMGGGLGISWIQVGTGAIPQTGETTDEYNEVVDLGVFSYYSNAYLLAYGRNITDNLSFGITAKYLVSDMPGLTVEGGTAYGYSLTPGLLYKLTPDLSFGLKLDEMANYQKWGTDAEEVAPSKWRFGIAYSTLLLNSYPMILSSDVSQINREGYVAEAGAGAEVVFGQLAMRLGYADQAMTAGAGLSCDLPSGGRIRIDYAYVTQTAMTKDNVHRISLTGIW